MMSSNRSYRGWMYRGRRKEVRSRRSDRSDKIISFKIEFYFMIKTVSDLEVFKISYQLAMDIFHTTRSFPKEERYSLTDQIVRSSRSISANIAEGWGKRIYENEFKRHLIYAMGSLEETKVWLYFSRDCSYIILKHLPAWRRNWMSWGQKFTSFTKTGKLYKQF